MNIQENVSLAPLCTFRIGGPAKYLIEVHTVDEVMMAVEFAHSRGLPILVLGGGSNMLISDHGFGGVVILMRLMGVECTLRDRETLYSVSAGVEWDAFVARTVSDGYNELANLSAIPGTVGATPVQNIGAYGCEVRETIYSVLVFDLKKKKNILMMNEECKFGYRDSVFKKEKKDTCIILRVDFLLHKNSLPNISYKDISLVLGEKKNIVAQDVRDAVIAIRTKKFPDLRVTGTAGSFFQNPIVDSVLAKQLQSVYTGMPVYPYHNGTVKISAAWLIDKVAQLRGISVGQVGTHSEQALVVVNHGGANAVEVRTFAERIIHDVFHATGVKLVPEVEYVGE